MVFVGSRLGDSQLVKVCDLADEFLFCDNGVFSKASVVCVCVCS